MLDYTKLQTHTPQEIFDHVASHLLNQGVPCTINGCCVMYDAATRNRCAAGSIVPLDKWKAIDKQELTTFKVYWSSLCDLLGIATTHDRLILRLQCIHDGLEPEVWEEHLYDLAELLNLSTLILDQRGTKTYANQSWE